MMRIERAMKREVRRVIRVVLLSVVLNCLTLGSLRAAEVTKLDGTWRFALDRADVGVRQQWFYRDLPERIKLPGVLQAQDYGDEISTQTPWVLSLYDRFWYLREDYKQYIKPGSIKVPFLSQPPRHYLGPAWYQREILIPQAWLGRRVVLTLERPHWGTTVWIDGQMIGTDKSLVAPQVYELNTISPGRHRLTIRVDNRLLMPYRPDAHSVSDSLGGSWNGIVGRIELTTTGRVWIDDTQVFPDLAQKKMLIKVRIGNQTGRAGAGTLTAIWPDIGVVPVNWDEHDGAAEIEVPLRFDAKTWDEFHPNLLPLTLWLRGTGVEEYKQLHIGLRDFHAEGKEFVLNGRLINFRGTHSGGDFPLTGYPPTDVASWRKLFETCRAWGLNHMRFHSWCPPEAAFTAADIEGVMLQPEGPQANVPAGVNPARDAFVEAELKRIVDTYGNHPSFCTMTLGNEYGGDDALLARWVGMLIERDPRHLYSSASNNRQRTANRQFTVSPKGRGIHGAGTNYDLREVVAADLVPTLGHEIAQWMFFPDFREM